MTTPEDDWPGPFKAGDRVRSIRSGWGGQMGWVGQVMPYTGFADPDPDWVFVLWDNTVESYGHTKFLVSEVPRVS